MTALPFDIVIKASALLAAAGLVDAVLRRRGSAAARSLVWALTMAALLALPVAAGALPHWLVRIPVARATAERIELAGARAAAVASAATPERATGSTRTSLAIAALSQPTATAPQPAAAEPGESPSGLASAALVGLGGIYAAGLLFLLLRLAAQPLALRRLARASRDVTDSVWVTLFEELQRQSRITTPVRLLQSTGEVMPMTFGTRHPVIVLPASA